jgi:hypothetical protein
MSFLQRLVEWRRTKAEDRTAIAKSEQASLRVGDEPEERETDASEDVLDAGSGTGATL